MNKIDIPTQFNGLTFQTKPDIIKYNNNEKQ